MSAVGLATGVVSVFFAIGIAVGVIGVVALGAIRGRRRATDWGQDRRTHSDVDADPREEDDGPPRWPGQ